MRKGRVKRIRQGQSRFLLETFHGSGGLADLIYVRHCMVVHVGRYSIHYFNGERYRRTSHWGWMQMYPTRRKAWAAAWAEVRRTDAIRNAEYAEAWGNGQDL